MLLLLAAIPCHSMHFFKRSFYSAKNIFTSFKSAFNSPTQWNTSFVSWDEDDFYTDFEKPKQWYTKPKKVNLLPLITQKKFIRFMSPDGDIEKHEYTVKIDLNKTPQTNLFQRNTRKVKKNARKVKNKHKEMIEEYEKAVENEFKLFDPLSDEEYKQLSFEEKIAYEVKKSVNTGIEENLLQIGSSKESATSKDIQNAIQLCKKDPGIQKLMPEMNRYFEKNNLKQKFIDCFKQKDRTNCIKKIKETTEEPVGSIYGGICGKIQFGLDHSKNKAISLLRKRSFAAISAGHPKNIFKKSKDANADI